MYFVATKDEMLDDYFDIDAQPMFDTHGEAEEHKEVLEKANPKENYIIWSW